MVFSLRLLLLGTDLPTILEYGLQVLLLIELYLILQPLALEELYGTEAVAPIPLQHLLEEGLHLIGGNHALGETQLLRVDHLDEIVDHAALGRQERSIPKQHHIDDHTH